MRIELALTYIRRQETNRGRMHQVLSYPALAGMSYPELDRRNLVRVVSGPERLGGLSADERAAIRVLMTSASRGCRIEQANALPNLELVVSQGSGQDKIDLRELAARGITVRCISEGLVDDVADLAMALTQSICRGLIEADAFARGGQWRQGRFRLGHSLVGMTMGIAGLSGRIGSAIATRARASRMEIASLDRPSNRDLGAALFADWVALAEASDVLVLALPGAADLKHVVDAKVLQALGSTGWLVNVARGSLVDTEALTDALENGVIAGAALDVLETEPEIPSRLAGLGNAVFTPHIGAQTWEQRDRSARIAEWEILSFLGLASTRPESISQL